MQELILLRDFDHWFQQLPLRQPGSSRQQFEPLRSDLTDCLSSVSHVAPLELGELRQLIEDRRRENDFIVTLDGGTYFQRFDFSFAMTRAVTRVNDAVKGKMIRVAREGHGQFWTQVATLRREFEESRQNRIVLCDDGIDTGKSLAEVVRQLTEQHLEVAGIRVLLNPNEIPEIEGVRVETLAHPRSILWTHERDLFWGTPTGGVSLISRNNSVNQLGGIPYSLTESLLRARLGLTHGDLSGVRLRLLEINREFWSLLSRAAGRSLKIRDCKRLTWATQEYPFTEQTLIVDFIDWLVQNQPSL